MNSRTKTTSNRSKSVALVATLFVLAFMQPAMAAKCKDVKTNVKNNRSQEIKIIKLEYYDTEKEKWRTEDFGTWKIASGTQEYVKKGLEFVKNQRVKTKIQWKYNTGGSQWSSVKTTTGPTISKCGGNNSILFTIK